MRSGRTLFLVIMVCSSGITYTLTDLDTTRNTIVAVLNREHPACVAEFNNFSKKYDALVSNFFDKKNNDPLKTHIEHMEIELQTLQHVCDDARYRSIRPILCNYHTHITELIDLLKQYVGSHDTLSLAFKVRKFKLILPEAVKQRGDISLFWALYHRLRCGQ